MPQPLPWWVQTLEEAAEWGCPPWVINEDDAVVLWSLRRAAYRAEIARAEKNKSKHGQ